MKIFKDKQSVDCMSCSTFDQIVNKNLEVYTCAICQRISFPPVRWNVKNPTDSSIPRCNHTYCLCCTRSYFQLDKKVSDRRETRLECCVCQHPLNTGSCTSGAPRNAKDVYYHCNGDDYEMVKLLMQVENEWRQCEEQGCDYITNDPECMRKHLREECMHNNLTCRYRSQGCSFVGFRDSVSEHEKECQFQILLCGLCNNTLVSIDKNQHLRSYHYISNTSLLSDKCFTKSSNLNATLSSNVSISHNHACVYPSTSIYHHPYNYT